eukprot:Phypoly_transcript_14597.p1 GENE.Phypoly_transcript_14597~~Phypoly_transcript_14597.p1  ORF type:complete len:210 (+),score=34.85 Phypoly_transcript_14597:99-728(+)
MAQLYSASLLRALNFAAFKHRAQVRKDSTRTPYINHPIGVAYILAEEGKVDDIVVLQAALLHDTVEDTDTTLEEIEREFGVDVRNVVNEVTDNKSLSKGDRKKAQVDHAPVMSQAAKLVKMADKLYNLRDIIRDAPASWDSERVQGYFVWAKKVLEGTKGINAGLEKALSDVFASDVVLQGRSYPVLPKDIDMDNYLHKYYERMSKTND